MVNKNVRLDLKFELKLNVGQLGNRSDVLIEYRESPSIRPRGRLFLLSPLFNVIINIQQLII